MPSVPELDQSQVTPALKPSSSPQSTAVALDALNGTRWYELANRVLAGHALTREEGAAILHSSDDELLDL
jgi:hypothetical protein